MKALLLILLSVCAAFGGDGYQYETNFLNLPQLKVKTGDVVKVRQVNKEKVRRDANGTVKVVLYAYRRHVTDEVQLTVTDRQWDLLEHTSTVYLRRGGERWELMGTQVYRDANGQTAYR